MKKVNENRETNDKRLQNYYRAKSMVEDCAPEFWNDLHRFLDGKEFDMCYMEVFTDLLVLLCDKEQYNEAVFLLYIMFGMLSIYLDEFDMLYLKEDLAKWFVILFTQYSVTANERIQEE